MKEVFIDIGNAISALIPRETEFWSLSPARSLAA
jgi:hypothetical protein